jgi:hypothetical protein
MNWKDEARKIVDKVYKDPKILLQATIVILIAYVVLKLIVAVVKI